MRWTAILSLGVVACAVAVTEPASAQIQPAGTGEPAYTNSAQNTQWFEWPAITGVGAYRTRYDYYENNVLRASPIVNRAGFNSGSGWANWSGVATLQHGAQYGICAQGQYTFPNDSLWISDGPNSCSMGTTLGRRAYTTIDRSKPTAALQLAAGAAFVKDSRIPLRVDFSDDVAGPFPANFICFDVGVGAQQACDTSAGKIYGYNAPCSVPANGSKTTTFSCTADYGEVADGNVWACVIAADASIPDNPSGPNQTATADKANLSNPSCDGVVVDRTPPAVSIGTASVSVKVGDLVSFQASASDATSGLAGTGQWTWGDNTGGGGGDAVTHTFTQPGTYEVALTVGDTAGNSATAKKTVTVTATAERRMLAARRMVATRRAVAARRMVAARRTVATRPTTATRRIPARNRRSSWRHRARPEPARSRSRSSSPPARPVASSSRSPAGAASSPARASGSTRTAPPTTASSSRRAARRGGTP